MFYRDSQQRYRCPAFDRLSWLSHGFGTRHSAPPEPLATVKQIHSGRCLAADGRHGFIGEGDALVDCGPGAALGVKTADCLSILLVDPGTRAIAAVHAGWRGTVAGIAARAVELLHARYGADPAGIEAAIGPGILRCCFEVGPEVAAEFGQSGRVHIDLEAINRSQLRAAGVSEARLHTSGLCTACDIGEFYSFRREKEQAGRLISFIGT